MDDLFDSSAPAAEGTFGDESLSFTGDMEFSSPSAATSGAPESGFVFMAADAPQEMEAAAAPAPFTGGAAATAAVITPSAAPAEEANPLVEFNKAFRAANEQKDAQEREAKAARKTAGKSALKQMLAERSKLVDARKVKNREDEVAKEKEMAEGLKGETWTRVSTLIDVHGVAAAASAAEGNKKKSSHDEVVGEPTRMKDVLIAVKNKPPVTAGGAGASS